jgi:prolipoprotein diacylglyceryltransferase
MENEIMEKIAFISGGTFFYWSSIILALAVATAIALYMAFYLVRGGSATGMSVAIPIALVLSIVLGRAVHWYSRTDAYAGFAAAMEPFSPGGYALLGAFGGCLITACLLRLIKLIPNLPAMLDAMAFGGGAGIAVGRLASLFNASDRGMVVADTVGFPFAYPVVNAVSGVAENRLATFMIQSMLTGGIVIALLIFVLVSALRRKKVRDGDVCLLFLLAYGACQIVCDSTRYDSLFLRSNGFISIVQILGLAALLIPVILFSVRMVRNRGMKVWFIPVWLATAGLLGGAAYMEYYVQRHGDMAGFSYSVMAGCLTAVVAHGLLIRKTGETRKN